MQCIDGNMLGKGSQIVMLTCLWHWSYVIYWDDLDKTLGQHRYLDASDLPDQITLEGYLCHISNLYLHDGEAVISRRFL